MSDVDFGLGSGTNYIKIDARAGCFKVKSGDEDLTFCDATFEVDIPGLDTGWFCFVKGQGVISVPGVHKPQPAPVGGIDFKKGFRVNIFGTEIVEGLGEPLGLRELASNAYGTRLGMSRLHVAFGADVAQHPGQVPVVHCDSFEAISLKNGSTFVAGLNIVGWVDRRREFIDAAGSAAPAAPVAKANVAPDHQRPIAAATATGPVDPDDSEFLAQL